MITNETKEKILSGCKERVMEAKKKIQNFKEINSIYELILNSGETKGAEGFLNLAKLFFMVNPNAKEEDFLLDFYAKQTN